MSQQIAVFGAGVMGETLLSGLIRPGVGADDLLGRRAAAGARRASCGTGTASRSSSNADAAGRADTLVLVVKPQDMATLLDEIAAVLRAGHPGGLARRRHHDRRSSRRGCPTGTPVVRVMPNTPALVDEGMAAISPRVALRRGAPRRGRGAAALVGKVVRVAGEAAGRGHRDQRLRPGVHLLRRRGDDRGRRSARAAAVDIHRAVVQTVVGSAKMLRETGEHPAVLREHVTSPAGTTVAALRALDDHKVRAAFLAAMEAARDRSRELAAGD